MKTCIACGGHLSLAAFGKNKAEPDGKMQKCLQCVAAYTAQRRAKDPIAFLLSGARSRAKRDGIPYDIRPEDIARPEFCPALGIRLNYEGTGRGYGAKDDAASLDRIDGLRGYVVGNVRVVSWKANRAKAFLTVEELVRLAEYYVSQ